MEDALQLTDAFKADEFATLALNATLCGRTVNALCKWAAISIFIVFAS